MEADPPAEPKVEEEDPPPPAEGAGDEGEEEECNAAANRSRRLKTVRLKLQGVDCDDVGEMPEGWEAGLPRTKDELQKRVLVLAFFLLLSGAWQHAVALLAPSWAVFARLAFAVALSALGCALAHFDYECCRVHSSMSLLFWLFLGAQIRLAVRAAALVLPNLATAFCLAVGWVGADQCDDALVAQSGDGCSDACTTEMGWFCTGGSTNSSDTCFEICGDGRHVGEEECDDGDLDGGDGCSGQGGDGCDALCSGGGGSGGAEPCGRGPCSSAGGA